MSILPTAFCSQHNTPITLLMTTSPRERLLYHNLDELSLQLRNAWTLYVRFYTAFLSFNLIAFGVASSSSFSPANGEYNWLAIALICQNCLSMGTSMYMARFSLNSASEADAVYSELNKLCDAPSESPKNPMPGQLGYWCGLANTLSILFLIVCWIGVLSKN